MMVLGIDPGTEHSGIVLLDVDRWKVVSSWSEMPNSNLLRMLRTGAWEYKPHGSLDMVQVHIENLFMETIEARGQIVGNSTIGTTLWVGRFEEVWNMAMILLARDNGRIPVYAKLIRRSDEKTILCGGSTVANPETGRRQGVTDANVRAAILAKFPATGGGKTPQVGIKIKPGPLFGMKGHAWSALAVAITGLEIRKADGK